MNFYTNISQWGNSLLVREVVDGVRLNTRVKYKPTLYAHSDEPTPFKTLKGGYVIPQIFNSIKEGKAFMEMYPRSTRLGLWSNNVCI